MHSFFDKKARVAGELSFSVLASGHEYVIQQILLTKQSYNLTFQGGSDTLTIREKVISFPKKFNLWQEHFENTFGNVSI